ncbi:hypothetical protein M569_06060 [Genlisea aurea]|uniref:Pectinesterase inhibitor domain-containing protein n=1 Tax=Genlisea aurea TaxID=192259 RepID=S8DZD3_9LAMI|nr:hypothetical protein M569_06060 [Genlisea aurea]
MTTTTPLFFFCLLLLLITTQTLSQTPKNNPTPTPTLSPYHFVDRFCLDRRDRINVPFCLRILRSSPGILNVKDSLGLLYAAAQSAMQFGNKTVAELNREKKTAAGAGAIEECVSAYGGYVRDYAILVEEAKTEAEMAAFDAELARNEVSRCVKAARKVKGRGGAVVDIRDINKEALDYARLAQTIAKSIPIP